MQTAEETGYFYTMITNIHSIIYTFCDSYNKFIFSRFFVIFSIVLKLKHAKIYLILMYYNNLLKRLEN